MRRLWDDAYASVKRPPNKYARVSSRILVCTCALAGVWTLLLIVLGLFAGFDNVGRALGDSEIVFGLGLRGALVFAVFLFAAYLTSDWLED